MKDVILLTDVNFWEQCSGNRQRIFQIIDYLAKNVKLTVVHTGPTSELTEEYLHSTFGAEFIILEKNHPLESAAYGNRLNAFLKKKRYDVVIIEYIHNTYLLNYVDRIDEMKIVLDVHDIISQRTVEFKKFDYTETIYELTEDQEKTLLDVYDFVLVLSETDLKTVNFLLGSANAILCPHPVTIKNHTVNTEVKSIAFVASSYLPNQDAITYFVSNCWQKIISKHNNVQLFIYGTVGDGLKLPTYDNISIMGFVSDLDEIYRQADIIINPVRFGAGLKIKNVEALAHGRPLVTTSHGSKGLENGINNAFLVADSDEEFLSAIFRLIDDYVLRKNIATQAIKYIRDGFSPNKCFGPLLQEINK